VSSPNITVFISYSHADAFLVAPVVALLRVNNSFVFQDITGIKPGKKWRREIDDALNKADLVVVFWCDHANKSDLVKIEWSSAVHQEKDLLPLLLDSTPLPPELAQYQWIDFQKVIGANHRAIEPSDLFMQDRTEAHNIDLGSPKTRSAWPRFLIGSLAGLAALAIISVPWYLSQPQQSPLPDPSAPPTSDSGTAVFSMASSALELVLPWVLGLLGLLVVSVISIKVWRRRKRAKPEPSFPSPSSPEPTPYSTSDLSDLYGSYRPYEDSLDGDSANRYAPKSIEQEIAGALEKEILRRQKR
jgi:hypothetical protein